MNEETKKKDEGNVDTTRQETSASAVPDSKLDGVVGGRVPVQDIPIVKYIDKSSP